LRQCIRCGHVKPWFRFFSFGAYNRSRICRLCAWLLKRLAVRDYEREFDKELDGGKRKEMLARVR
jgi:hypothetical protein